MNYTLRFQQLDKNSIPAAGGKGANLGEMTAAGLPVPAGFVLTTAAYDAFVAANRLQAQIVALAQESDVEREKGRRKTIRCFLNVTRQICP